MWYIEEFNITLQFGCHSTLEMFQKQRLQILKGNTFSQYFSFMTGQKAIYIPSQMTDMNFSNGHNGLYLK